MIVTCDGKRCRYENVVVDFSFIGNNKDGVVFLVGEAPYKTEVKQGKPFVGASGRVLRKYLDPDHFMYIIGNSMNCLSYQNGVEIKPSEMPPEEVEARINNCHIYLDDVLNKYPEAMIITLGRFASKSFLGVPAKASAEPKIYEHHGNKHLMYNIYHPAYILYQPGMRKSFEKMLSATGVFKVDET